MAQMSFEEYNNNTKRTVGTKDTKKYISYFSLADDGDTALVRFNISDIKDIVVHSVHSIYINEKRKEVECLRKSKFESVDTCPLCKAEQKITYRIYIPLLKYINEGDSISIVPCIWETTPRFRETLNSYLVDYGDLRDKVFKVTRHGKRGDTGTTYSLIPANPQVYTNEVYISDFSAFDNFSLNSYFVLNKNTEDLNYFLTNKSFPSSLQKTSNTPNSAEVLSKRTETTQESVPFVNMNNNTQSKENQPETISRTPRRYVY